jgi:hypothetical protein
MFDAVAQCPDRRVYEARATEAARLTEVEEFITQVKRDFDVRTERERAAAAAVQAAQRERWQAWERTRDHVIRPALARWQAALVAQGFAAAVDASEVYPRHANAAFGGATNITFTVAPHAASADALRSGVASHLEFAHAGARVRVRSDVHQVADHDAASLAAETIDEHVRTFVKRAFEIALR